MNLWNQTYQVRASTTRAFLCALIFVAFTVIWYQVGLYLLKRNLGITTEFESTFLFGFMMYSIASFGVSYLLGVRGSSYLTGQRAHDVAIVKIRSLRSELNQVREKLANSDDESAQDLNETAIISPTLTRLQSAVIEFPSHYPQYKSRPPKLDDDIRPWLKSVGYAKNDREAFVFGSVISEHFEL